MNAIDPVGLEPIYDKEGRRLGFTSDGFLGPTGMIYVYKGDRTDIDWSKFSRKDLKKEFGYDIQNAEHYILELEDNTEMKGLFLSNVATDIVKEYDGFEINYEDMTYKFHFNDYGGEISYMKGEGNFNTIIKTPGGINFNIGDCYLSYELNGYNILSTLLYHEWFGHAIMGWGDETKTHHKCFEMVKNGKFFNSHYPQSLYYNYINTLYEEYKNKEMPQP